MLLKNYAQTDEILFKHLNGPSAKNAMYTSPRSQNDIINIIGYDIDNICKIFLSKHPRRMSIVSVIIF